MKDTVRELCECLNLLINSTDKFIDAGSNKPVSLLLHSQRLLQLTMMSLEFCKKLKGCQTESDELVPSIYDTLMIRDVRKSYFNVCKKINKIFCNVIEQYEGSLVCDWANEDDIEYLTINEHLDETITEDYIRETNRISLSSRKDMHTSLSKISQVLLKDLKSGAHILAEICPDDDVVIELVEDAIKSYSKENGETVFRDLKRETKLYKPYGALYSPEIWGALMANEENVLTQAVNGKLVESDDVHYDPFADDMRKQMEKSNDLMQKIINVSLDDELFDFDYAAEPHINLYDALNAENFDVFQELVLRHNLIVCEIHPELKTIYKGWLNDEIPETSQGCTLPTVLSTPEAMQYWGELQAKNIIDENYKPKEETTLNDLGTIAVSFSKKLGFKSTKWKLFEGVFDVKYLAQSINRMNDLGNAPSNDQLLQEVFE